MVLIQLIPANQLYFIRLHGKQLPIQEAVSSCHQRQSQHQCQQNIRDPLHPLLFQEAHALLLPKPLLLLPADFQPRLLLAQLLGAGRATAHMRLQPGRGLRAGQIFYI